MTHSGVACDFGQRLRPWLRPGDAVDFLNGDNIRRHTVDDRGYPPCVDFTVEPGGIADVITHHSDVACLCSRDMGSNAMAIITATVNR